MLIFRLAFKNIMGAGIRTWLNVLVLSFVFVAIIWAQGLISGMGEQAITSKIDAELGGGQFWHKSYDPYDPLTIEDSHGPLSKELILLDSLGQATPILITSGAIYPDGRIQSAMLKGIDPNQQIIGIPAQALNKDLPDAIPALIGQRMAKQTHLKVGDYVTARWRDISGTFDATDLKIIGIMTTTVPTVDNGQIWVPLNKLREMLDAPEDEATLVVLKKDIQTIPVGNSMWIHRDLDYLLEDIVAMVSSKRVGNAIMFSMLFAMALLAIFDTQVLAIFRRKKEMGTLIALGMTRYTLVALFTLEGALHGLLALIVGGVYGIPLLALSAAKGLPMPEVVEDSGFAIADTLYPSYGIKLVLITTCLVLITVTIVSYLPTLRISKMKPTDAIRGRMA